MTTELDTSLLVLNTPDLLPCFLELFTCKEISFRYGSSDTIMSISHQKYRKGSFVVKW